MENERRILLVVRWPVGGIRTFLRYVYAGFDSASWQYTVLAPDLSELRVLLDEDLKHLKVKYVPVSPDGGTAAFFRSVTSELISGGYRLVHSHGFTAGICCAFPARVLGVRHIMTSHDVINESQFSGMKGKVSRAVVGGALKMIDAIHCVGSDARENLLGNFPSLLSDRCITIENGIEVERFLQASPADFRAQLGLDDSVFLIGFLGRFMSQKGFRYLVEAVDILRTRQGSNRKFLVLCFGDGGFVREEKRELERKGLSDAFRFMPFVSNVAAVIKGVDVVVMPSLWEACGLLAMETLVCGVPLIATECVGLREVVQGTPAFKVPVRDGGAIAGILERLMREDVRGAFQANVEESAIRFDVSVQRKKLAQLYAGLLSADQASFVRPESA